MAFTSSKTNIWGNICKASKALSSMLHGNDEKMVELQTRICWPDKYCIAPCFIYYFWFNASASCGEQVLTNLNYHSWLFCFRADIRHVYVKYALIIKFCVRGLNVPFTVSMHICYYALWITLILTGIQLFIQLYVIEIWVGNALTYSNH
jgi:hypothetical protein